MIKEFCNWRFDSPTLLGKMFTPSGKSKLANGFGLGDRIAETSSFIEIADNDIYFALINALDFARCKALFDCGNIRYPHQLIVIGKKR
jgi:hypothetical protein